MNDLINRLLSLCDPTAEAMPDGVRLTSLINAGREAVNEICALKSRIEIRGAPVKRVQAEALDEKALEAAREAWDIEDNLNDALTDAIRAYLASLPEAPAVPVVTMDAEFRSAYLEARTELKLAASRLQRCAVDHPPNSREFFERSEWAREARAAIKDIPDERL